jgi:hypothetical protein
MATRAQSYASHRRWHVLLLLVGFPVLSDMVRAILAGEVRDRKDIKRRIRTWRSDWLRV